MDTKTITPTLFTPAFPAGTKIITTSPPILAQHLPRAHKGGVQPAQAALLKIVRLIQYLATTQTGGVGFISDTSVRISLPAHVVHTMGPSTVLNAPKCGSGAHRPPHILQNLLPQSELEAAYKSIPNPLKPVDAILAAAGLGEWRTPLPADPTVTKQPRTMLRGAIDQTTPQYKRLTTVKGPTPTRGDPNLSLPKGQRNPPRIHTRGYRSPRAHTRATNATPS